MKYQRFWWNTNQIFMNVSCISRWLQNHSCPIEDFDIMSKSAVFCIEQSYAIINCDIQPESINSLCEKLLQILM